MKRTDADEHSSNLFQDENLPTTAGTLIEETWLNSVQEEIARAIEGSGQNLTVFDYYQSARAHNRYGPADFLYSPTGQTFGMFHPPNVLSGGDTFWAAQTAGLTGYLRQGAVWVHNAGRLVRIGISSSDIVAGGFDSHTFGDEVDAYVAVNITDASSIEINEVANGAGAPSPSSGYVNALKVITNVTDITDVEALYQAFPDLSAQALRLQNTAVEDRDTVAPSGLVVYGTNDASRQFENDRVEFMFYEGLVARSNPISIIQTDAATGGRIITRGRLDHEAETSTPDFDDVRRLRTHYGTAIEQGQRYWERTVVGDLVGVGSLSFALDNPANTEVWKVRYEIIAVDSSDITRSFTKEATFRAHMTGGTLTIGAEFNAGEDDQTTPDFGAVANVTGNFLYIRTTSGTSDTWRITLYYSVLPTSTAA